MAAEDVATAVVEAALAPPANGMIEVGGPEKFHLDELLARVLEYDKDPRKVVIDPDAAVELTSAGSLRITPDVSVEPSRTSTQGSWVDQ